MRHPSEMVFFLSKSRGPSNSKHLRESLSVCGEINLECLSPWLAAWASDTATNQLIIQFEKGDHNPQQSPLKVTHWGAVLTHNKECRRQKKTLARSRIALAVSAVWSVSGWRNKIIRDECKTLLGQLVTALRKYITCHFQRGAFATLGVFLG